VVAEPLRKVEINTLAQESFHGISGM
jgi:hypothetical protein